MDRSEDIPDEELEEDSIIVMDTTTDITRVLSELNSLLARIDRLSSANKAEASSAGSLSALQEKIDKLVELETLRMSTSNYSLTDYKEATQSKAGSSVRLPKIEFEKFSGDVLRFQEFWDSFDVAINSNTTLQPVEKLSYLRAYLSGEAKDVISGVSSCDANYDVAVQLIRKRFGNPQASIDAHYSHLMNLEVTPNDTNKLRCLFDEIEKHLRCLSALGEDIEHRHFISLIMSKLPRQVIIRLEESKADEDLWTVALLRKKLQSQLSARECADRKQTSSSSYFQSQNQPKAFVNSVGPARPTSGYSTGWHGKSRTGRTTTESLLVGEHEDNRGSILKCIFCIGDHHSDQCQRFASSEERRVRIKGRCYICLKKGHLASQCSSVKPCYHCKQVKRHHRCLCPRKFPASFEASAVTAEEEEEEPPCVQSVDPPQHAIIASGEKVLLQTATVEVKGRIGGQTVRTRALLDSGSNRSYISASLAAKIGARSSGSESFSVVTFGAEKPKTVETSVTQICLALKNGSSKTLDVSIVKKITGNILRAPIDFRRVSFLWKDLPLADTLPVEEESSPVDFLIGNDYYLDLITAEKIQIRQGLYLLGSQLGWILSGRFQAPVLANSGISLFVTSYMNQSVPCLSNYSNLDECLQLKPSFEDYWRLETIGIKDPPEVKDDDRALMSFNSTVKFENGRYQVTWPWKDIPIDLPDNYELALGRFKSLVRKFEADPTLLSKYSAVIKEQEEKGVIEKINHNSTEGIQKHYIPHHPVINLTKSTTKVRIVYDASAKCRKSARSLNECLLRGPVILEDLCGLLLRFRLHPFAVVADIEKAFLQIELQLPDRDVTRFFWLKNPEKASTENNIQPYRFCRVPFGVISSPFLLGATIRYHLAQDISPSAQKFRENLYVDNVVTGVSSHSEAKQLYCEGKSLFAKASMNLRQWASNSQDFMKSIPETDTVRDSVTKVLGINWNIKEDYIAISKEISFYTQSSWTKRRVFQALASVFDPLGFFIPLTLKGKLFIHQMWTDRLDWDDAISRSQEAEWYTILIELEKIPTLKIPRLIGWSNGNDKTVSLFCFCDASALAYSTVIYLKVTQSDITSVSLIYGKCRLAPSKTITIPRMELLAVLIGVRCLEFIQRQIRVPVIKKILWTDSQCVLHWITSKKPLTVFVENRLKEIRKHVDVMFKYVSTCENTADLATRAKCSFEEMNASNWWNGPPWLRKAPELWPTWPYNVPEIGDENGNTDSSLINSTIIAVTDTVNINPPFSIELSDYSSALRLFRVTAWLSRFIDKARKRSSFSEGLVATEIQRAKQLWEKHIQAAHFSEALHAITKGATCCLKDQLNLQQDKAGILRCLGRFANSEDSDKRKFPVLLPSKSHYTDLIIRQYHERLLHSGVSHTLSQIRSEYWIPQGRSAVRRFIIACRRCRRFDGGSYRIPQMPPWPAIRITRSAPFSYTGIDYFGPLYVRHVSGTKKVWVCLFTCLAVRAIHLEMVEEMSAHHFLLCLRRFIARRRKPIQIISDNATQFKLSKKILDILWGKTLTDRNVKSFVSAESISWKFIVEKAPWMGGFYERLVGSVKRTLKKGIGRICLSQPQLETTLAEIEAIVNSRPLCYVGDDIQAGNALTPAHFLSFNHPNNVLPDFQDKKENDSSFVQNPDSSAGLIQAWKKGLKLLDNFWKSWRNDYLSSLRERSDYAHKQNGSTRCLPPQVGDIVLIKDDNLSRTVWKIGKIESLIISQDGEVRSAQVLHASGKILKRPLKILYPLEWSQSSDIARSKDDTFEEASAAPKDDHPSITPRELF